MRVAIFKFPFTYEFFTPVITNETVTWTLDHTGAGRVVVGGGGGSLSLMTENPLDVGGIVRNIRDAKGNDVLRTTTGTYDMYVHASDPQLNPFSEVVGFKHSLRRQQVRDFEQLLQDLVSGV